jgi:uncharacterized membrane protein (DUF485 family)
MFEFEGALPNNFKEERNMTALASEPKGKPDVVAGSDKIMWSEAFESDTFKKISRKRFRFVVPALLLFSGAFFALWIMQSSFSEVSSIRIYGWINMNFVATMAIFPFTWILGYVYVRYIYREVYPLEEELILKFKKGTKHE